MFHHIVQPMQYGLGQSNIIKLQTQRMRFKPFAATRAKFGSLWSWVSAICAKLGAGSLGLAQGLRHWLVSAASGWCHLAVHLLHRWSFGSGRGLVRLAVEHAPVEHGILRID